MVRLAHIYTSNMAFDKYLSSRNFNKSATCFVRVFTSGLNKEQAVQVAKEVRTMLPNAYIMGASSSQAVLYNGEQMAGETIVLVETYQRLRMKLGRFTFKNKTAQELAREIHHNFCMEQAEKPPIVHILFSNPNIGVAGAEIDVDSFIQEINKLKPCLHLVGGIAGDLIEQGILGFVFDETGVLENGVFAFTTSGSDAYNFVNVSNSMEMISPVFEITKTEGVFIDEIESQPALDWLCDFLQLKQDTLTTFELVENTAKYDHLLHFPLIVENASGSGRFTRYDAKHHKLGLYHARLQNHTKFRMGYVNPVKTVREARDTCEAILDTPVEYLFAYICLIRKLCLDNCAKWELMPFAKHDICGIFMMGEIACLKGENHFHNGASVLTGLAENEKYILPDIHCLDNTDPIKDDLKFLNKAKEKGKAYLRSKNADLIPTLDQYLELNENKKMDEYVEVPNFYQFEEDRIAKKYDKLLLVESLTADATIAMLGHQRYYSAIRDVVVKVKNYLIKNNLEDSFNMYSLNYKTYILACSVSVSDEYFKECTYIFYRHFEYISSEKEGVSGVLRFVAVLKQKNLIEAGMNMLLANTNQDNNYLVCDYSIENKQSVAEESRVIDVLNRAITNKMVVPFYQGIRNNKTGNIDKYEALMRVIDSTGKVHTPALFMDVAKKYKYYGRISKMMIERVLKDFENRHKTVSINITLYDVQSESFRKWLIKTLQGYPHPERLVFEFVETENFQTVELLADFVDEIRSFGCCFALDDFGSGYSTLASVITLHPDFIKIDGSIIRNLLKNKESLIILNTIRYLAQQLNVETVAEFVETQELQQVVELYSISHSQGYYFAKPEPIENLPLAETGDI